MWESEGASSLILKLVNRRSGLFQASIAVYPPPARRKEAPELVWTLWRIGPQKPLPLPGIEEQFHGRSALGLVTVIIDPPLYFTINTNLLTHSLCAGKSFSLADSLLASQEITHILSNRKHSLQFSSYTF